MPREKAQVNRIRPTHVLFLLLGLTGVYYLAIQLGDVQRTLGLLARSSWLWVFGAVVATTLALLCAAWVQYLAGNKIGRPRELFALILAGELFDHFLPFSLGGVGLVTAYYRRHNQANARSIIMASSPVVVGALVALGVLLVISPGTVAELLQTVKARALSPVITYAAAGIVAVSVICLAALRQRIKRQIVDGIAALHDLRGQRQIVAVAAWSLVRSLLATTTLYMSVLAVHGSVSFFAVVIIFLLSLFISEATPTPGGIGATEAVLVVGLAGVGLDTTHAVAATLMYRFVTFILPMLPGVAVMAYARRLVDNHYPN